jgi:hypothetical protein
MADRRVWCGHCVDDDGVIVEVISLTTIQHTARRWTFDLPHRVSTPIELRWWTDVVPHDVQR